MFIKGKIALSPLNQRSEEKKKKDLLCTETLKKKQHFLVKLFKRAFGRRRKFVYSAGITTRNTGRHTETELLHDGTKSQQLQKFAMEPKLHLSSESAFQRQSQYWAVLQLLSPMIFKGTFVKLNKASVNMLRSYTLHGDTQI